MYVRLAYAYAHSSVRTFALAPARAPVQALWRSRLHSMHARRDSSHTASARFASARELTCGASPVHLPCISAVSPRLAEPACAQVLGDITYEDIKEMGISEVGPRRKVWLSLQRRLESTQAEVGVY